jgi:REP element-mobilizing transposase RayT
MGGEPKFFNDRGEIKVTKNRLPHWEQDGCSYFITFRLADSLPKRLLDEWKEERRIWLEQHPEPWGVEIEQAYHQRFSAARERWLDAGHGDCVLKRSLARQVFVSCLKQQDCEVWSCVVMPNHVHLLLSLSADVELSVLMQRLKGGSSFEINQSIGRSGALWARDYFDRLIRDQNHFFKCARYIRRNPLKSNLGRGAYTLVESQAVQQMLGGS